MPQFLEPNAAELNAFRMINKKIVKDQKRQYRGTESTLGVEGDIQDKYNFVYEKMVEIIGSLGEISNQLKLGHIAPMGTGSKAVDRFVGGTSAVVRATRILLNYISQEVPTLHIFPVEQQQSISSLNDEMVRAVIEIDQLSTQYLPPATLTRFRQVIQGFKGDLTVLQQKLEGQQGDMGTGSIGDTSKGKSSLKETRAKYAQDARAEAAAAAKEKKEKADVKEIYRAAHKASVQGSGYGKGYRTQIAGGMMPSRFL